MTRLHIELIKNTSYSELILKFEEIVRHREIKRRKILTNKNTGNTIFSLETDSSEIINSLQDLLQNSGGRILTNEEYELYTSVSKGDKNSEVVSLKRDLYEKGYYNYHPDLLPPELRDTKITFDEETELAVKDFQRANGLKVTGIANEETIEKLRES